MNSHSSQSPVPRKTLVLGAIVLLVSLAVALGAFHPFQFGHTGLDEIAFTTQIVSNSCADKFCSAVCPSNYRVVGGGCSVQTPRFNQLNLVGADGNKTAWNCFDSAWVPGMSNVQATATCLQVGNDSPSNYQFCGNYTIERVAALPGNFAETCDMNNTSPYNCTYFNTQGGTPLCDPFLSCLTACNNYDVSTCQYCNPGSCNPGEILCNDHTCQTNCADHGGGSGSGTQVGGTALGCSPNTNCSGVSDVPSTPNSSFCGNAILEYTEQCDVASGDVDCPQQTSVACEPGQHVIVDVECTQTCTCQDNSICVPDICPGSTPCTSGVQCASGVCSGGCCEVGSGGGQPV